MKKGYKKYTSCRVQLKMIYLNCLTEKVYHANCITICFLNAAWLPPGGFLYMGKDAPNVIKHECFLTMVSIISYILY